MRQFFIRGNKAYEIGRSYPDHSFQDVLAGIRVIGYFIGVAYNFVVHFAAGLGIGLLIKLVWHIIFG